MRTEAFWAAFACAVLLLCLSGCNTTGGDDDHTQNADDDNDESPTDDDVNGDDDNDDNDNDNNDSIPPDDDSAGDDDDDNDDTTPDIEFFATSDWSTGWPYYIEGCSVGHWRGGPPALARWPFCDFGAIWGAGPAGVFAVGYAAPALGAFRAHFDGARWRAQYGLPPYTEFWGVFGSSEASVYAAGASGYPNWYWLIYRFDGQEWSEAARGQPGSDEILADVWVAQTGEVFAVGSWNGSGYDGGWMAVQNDGGAWLEVRGQMWLNGLSGVWGASADDVFAVGGVFMAPENSLVLHYNGLEWTDVEEAPHVPRYFFDVEGYSESDVYVVGADRFDPADRGWVYHYDGATWTDISGPEQPYAESLWVAGPQSVFVPLGSRGIIHWDGHEWTQYSDIPATHLWGFVHSGGEDH